tara:strand:- start:9466 stop:9669 length:204 start_codon:yes stop_codon:yes gene_type:complete
MNTPNVTTSSLSNECSICDQPIKPGTQFLDLDTYYPTPICKACVEHAALKFNPSTPDAWGRKPEQLL